MDNTTPTPTPTPTPTVENEIILPETMVVPSKYCALMYNMIHVLAKRGGINADEFAVVGELVTFLKTELKVEEQLANQKAAAAEAQ
tara:strand:- start:4638 stop:4895 length:258 start_codon:yes stop_codon:yes gene_type:complete